MIKVTVGIPVYNGEEFLAKCLDSIINQTYKNIEIIISDNQSDDLTQEICYRYASKDSRIKYIRQEVNRGSMQNFIILAEAAVGEYFMWAGADDVLDANWINNLLSKSERFNCLTFGIVQYINQHDAEIVSTANRIVFEFKGPRLYRQIKYIFTPWVYGKMILCWGLFPRKKLLNIINKSFVPRWVGAVDSIFVFNVLEICNIISVDKVVLHKRNHTNSESAVASSANRKESNSLICKLLSFLKINMIFEFAGSMSTADKIVLIFLTPIIYPIYILRSTIHLIKYKINRRSS